MDYTIHGIFPGQNTGVGSLSLLKVIFPIQGLNPSLPHCRRILYQLSHKGSFPKLKMVLRSIIQSLETNTAVVFLEELSSLYQLRYDGSSIIKHPSKIKIYHIHKFLSDYKNPIKYLYEKYKLRKYME